jgi:hypothetical protein
VAEADLNVRWIATACCTPPETVLLRVTRRSILEIAGRGPQGVEKFRPRALERRRRSSPATPYRPVDDHALLARGPVSKLRRRFARIVSGRIRLRALARLVARR